MIGSAKSITLLLLLLLLCPLAHALCHYTCFTCTQDNYYSCSLCNSNRGEAGYPVAGMCYCDNNSDEDENGACQNSGSFNYRSKVLIVVFISLTLVLAVFAVVSKSMKYFLYKTMEDVQELSLIVFINMYFPQQFDIFLSALYRFNISSYTFANLAEGSLFYILPDSSVATVDAQNIFGKYRLLKKTANFFGNQFTWLIVFLSIIVFAVLVRLWRNWLKKRRDIEEVRREVEGMEESHSNLSGGEEVQWVEVRRRKREEGVGLYWLVNKVSNMLWFNVLIVFFYFSLIEMNINIFTQIANLTFSSSFATTGAFFSALFLAAEVILLLLLFLKAKEEMVKPEWMRDYSFTPTIYLVRTNFKSVTKYFWFFSCLKKILLAMMITVFYKNPLGAIVAVSSVHSAYLALAIYCEPFERKYLRAHFYITEGAKLFLFLGLINFTTKYTETVQLISLTSILYTLLAFVFGMHLFFLLVSMVMEREVYKHFWLRKCCPEEHPELAKERVGYRSEDKLFIYVRE